MGTIVSNTKTAEIVINRAFPIVQEVPAPDKLIAKAVSVFSDFNLGCHCGDALFQMASLSFKPILVSMSLNNEKFVISSGSLRAYAETVGLFRTHEQMFAHREAPTLTTSGNVIECKKACYPDAEAHEIEFVKYIHIGGKTHFHMRTREHLTAFSHLQITLALYHTDCPGGICYANLIIIPCKRDISHKHRIHAAGIPFLPGFAEESNRGKLIFMEVNSD